MRRYFLILLFVLVPATVFAARLDTSFTFSTIETEHFSIHYHQGLNDVARKVAVIAEDTHTTLTKQFKWTPREKTQIVLVDNFDFTNGFATVLPYNFMYLFIVPPTIDLTIGEYDDWLKMLVIHEYAHIVTMDSARGYSEVTRAIFGKPLPVSPSPFSLLTFFVAAPPNVFMPGWWHEGMATWSETEFSNAGRGRSSYYAMVFRMAVEENNIPSVDKLNGEIPYWPDGHVRYMFGMRFQKYLADKYGSNSLGDMNITHAGRFPYFINGAASNVMGQNYISLYDDMLAELLRVETDGLNFLKRSALTSYTRFTLSGEQLTNPRFSPDGKYIVYAKQDPHQHQTAVLINADGSGEREIFRTRLSDNNFTWSPDSTKIYFSQAEIVNGFNVYQDIYQYSLKTDETKRLTYGLRIKDTDLSPDGQTFAAVLSNRGNQKLVLLNMKDLTTQEIAEYPLMRAANPRWSPDGTLIAYTVTDNEGATTLFIYDTQQKTFRKLLEGRFDIAYPVWSRDGQTIIFVSDETGIFNLFACSVADGTRRQITHTLGGVFFPDISPDGKTLVFSDYHSKGFSLASLPYAPETWRKDAGPVIPTYWKPSAPKPLTGTDTAQTAPEPVTQPQIETKPAQTVSAPHSYAPEDTLLPRFWLPNLFGDHDGAVVGAMTLGQDVLGYHAYFLELDYGLPSGQMYYNVIYQNDSFYPTFLLQAYAQPFLYADLFEEGDYYELNKSVKAEVQVPIYRLESGYRFILGFHHQEQEALSDLTNDLFEGLPVFQGNRNNAYGGIQFSNILKYPYSISHEEGRTITVLHKYYSRSLGSDLHAKEYTGTYKEYISVFPEKLRHHVAYLSLNGGISSGQRTVQNSFQMGGLPGMFNDYSLRGYPLRFKTGKYITTGTLEYRAPIENIYSGPGTAPFFLEKLHGALFVDAGEVWGDEKPFAANRAKLGFGGEIRLDMTVGYWISMTPALGVAHGISDDGETTVYVTIYVAL